MGTLVRPAAAEMQQTEFVSYTAHLATVWIKVNLQGLMSTAGTLKCTYGEAVPHKTLSLQVIQ